MTSETKSRPLLDNGIGATLNRIHEKTGIRRDVLRAACASGELRHSRLNSRTIFIYWADFHVWMATRSRGGCQSDVVMHAAAVLARNAERRQRRGLRASN